MDHMAHGVTRGHNQRVARWILATEGRTDLGAPQRVCDNPPTNATTPFPTGRLHDLVAAEGCIALPSSNHMRSYLPFSAPGSLLLSPLDNRHYAGFATRSPILPKRRLVVLDDDYHGRSALTSAADLQLPADVEVVDLSTLRLPGDLIVSLLEEAMVILDLYLPGTERMSYEGVLCGAMPLIAAVGHGTDQGDFPLPASSRVDPHDLASIRDRVLSALDGYEHAAGSMGPMVAATLAHPLEFLASVDRLFSSSALHITITHPASSSSSSSLLRLLATLLSCHQHFPLARIVVLVGEDRAGGLLASPGGSRLVALLSSQGLTSPQVGRNVLIYKPAAAFVPMPTFHALICLSCCAAGWRGAPPHPIPSMPVRSPRQHLPPRRAFLLPLPREPEG